MTNDAPPHVLDPRVLDKVRAPLAKAESSSFDHEAEAFTAKAQELMTQYRIERALVDADGAGRHDQPVSRRILVPDPYAEPKAILLSRIADANGCTAVWSKGLGFSTVFGFSPDLDAVDTLFASLLVQATGALRRSGPRYDRLGRSQTRRFRRSFLLSFAIRIGQRLDEAVAATVHAAGAEIGTDLLPVLASRVDPGATASIHHQGVGMILRVPIRFAECRRSELVRAGQSLRPVKAARRSIGVADAGGSTASANASPPRMGASASLAKDSTSATSASGGS
jgi:hypothetical protein